MSLTSAPPAQAARLAPTAPTRPHPGPEPIAPSRRDAAIDAVRAVSLLGVVVLHALMVGAGRTGSGALRTSVALSGEPWFAPMTWVLQVMPLFFIAGGFAALAQWRRMRDRGASATEYVASRVRRLAVPALIMIGAVGAILLTARSLGADPGLISEASLRIGQPLWFLAVYLGTTALVPIMAGLHERWPAATIAALAIGVFVVDLAQAGFGIPIGYLNLAFIWLLMQQLGFLMQSGACATWSRRTLLTGVAVSLGLLLVLLACGRSPDMLENLNPPTTALALLGSAQFFALNLIRGSLDAAARGPVASRIVAWAGETAMGIYLWHMPVILALVAILWIAGFPLPEPHSAAWWVTRGAWLLAVAACVLPFARFAARCERRALRWIPSLGRPRLERLRRRPWWPRLRQSRPAACVLLAIAGTATALIAGIATPLPYLCAVALLAASIVMASASPRRV